MLKYWPCRADWLSLGIWCSLHSQQTPWTCSTNNQKMNYSYSPVIWTCLASNQLIWALDAGADGQVLVSSKLGQRSLTCVWQWMLIVLQPVVVHQHVDKVFEEVRLAGAEEASWDLVHGLLQLRDFVVVRQGIVAGNQRHLQNHDKALCCQV